MHERWLPWCLAALVSWGCWGLFPKLATNYISPRSAFMYEALGAALAAVCVAVFLGAKPEVNAKGMLFGVLAGAAALAGAWFYVNAAALGRVSVVVTLTALYPLITIVLAFVVLREPIGLRRGIGMLLALAAIALMST
jgi:transporter family protein